MTVKTVFDLPSTPECARNGEGAFVYAGNGDLLYAYSEFHTADPNDNAPSNIALLRSRDGGETWEYEGIIVDAVRAFGVSNVMCVCPATLNDGATAFFFLIKENDGTTTLGRTVTRDSGKTFHAERCGFHAVPAYYVLENDRMIRLSDGRLATALSRHNPPSFSQAVSVAFVSDDDGKTFTSVGECGVGENSFGESILEEPGLLERADGSVLLWARTCLGAQYIAVSEDGLKSFSEPIPSRFPSPRSPMILKREGGNRWYAVFNPIPDPDRKFGRYGIYARTPLVLEVSADDGQTWGERIEICPDRDSVYMYPAVFETRTGELLVAFMYKKIEAAHTMNLGMKILKIAL